MSEGGRPVGPLSPLPMHPAGPAEPSEPRTETAPKEVRVTYIRYRDPNALEFPERATRLTGPVFHAAGVLLREDERFLALGEVAFGEENIPLAGRYGADMFPAYRNVLTVPKESVLERRDFRIEVPSRSSSPG